MADRKSHSTPDRKPDGRFFRVVKPIPHFLIGGAPRSGTTWLYELLRRHPDIYLAQPVRPEPKFFLVDSLYALGIDHYRDRWFSDVPEGKIAGEKSTNYLESPVAAARIARHLPGVKLVFILRDPAQRAYSNYLWSRMNGKETENFETALQLEEMREKNLDPTLRFARPHAYFGRGLYAQLLRPYFELFPSGQILCLRYEDLVTAPQDLAERLHRFLGIIPRPRDADGLGVVNPADVSKTEAPPDLKALRERYAAPNRELGALVGSDFKIWEV
jgi:hypothetical protein